MAADFLVWDKDLDGAGAPEVARGGVVVIKKGAAGTLRVPVGAEVTVTSEGDGVVDNTVVGDPRRAGITLHIPRSSRVIWTAKYASSGDYSAIEVTGGGDLKIAEGAVISGKNSVLIDASDVVISGGIVRAAGDYAITGGYVAVWSGEVTVSGCRLFSRMGVSRATAISAGSFRILKGLVRASGKESCAVCARSVAVEGGEVRASGKESRAVGAESGSVKIEKGLVRASGEAACAVRTKNGNVAVSGGEVRASGDAACAVCTENGNVAVSGGKVRVSGECVYAICTDNGNVAVSGGEVGISGVRPRACAIVTDNGNITVSGGKVRASCDDSHEQWAIGTHNGKVSVSEGSVTGNILTALGQE